MGNETSQLSSPDRHDRRVFGPAMPPSPSDNDSENGQVIGPAMSPLPSYNEPDQSRGDQEASQDDGLHNPHYLADGLPRFAPEFVPRTATPNERRHETLNSADDEPRVILSFARRGSPPSAQSPPPLADGLPKYEPVPEGGNLKYERVLAYGGHEDALVAFNQTNGVQGSSSGILDPRQIKTESVADHDLPFAIAGPLDDVREVRQNESTAAPRWLHKREDQDPNDMPLTDTRTDSEREADAALPDLLPCQVKTEPPSDSDSDSPSAARLQRLSRSRSRSVASTSRSAVQADQVVSHDNGLAGNVLTMSCSSDSLPMPSGALRSSRENQPAPKLQVEPRQAGVLRPVPTPVSLLRTNSITYPVPEARHILGPDLAQDLVGLAGLAEIAHRRVVRPRARNRLRQPQKRVHLGKKSRGQILAERRRLSRLRLPKRPTLEKTMLTEPWRCQDLCRTRSQPQPKRLFKIVSQTTRFPSTTRQFWSTRSSPLPLPDIPVRLNMNFQSTARQPLTRFLQLHRPTRPGRRPAAKPKHHWHCPLKNQSRRALLELPHLQHQKQWLGAEGQRLHPDRGPLRVPLETSCSQPWKSAQALRMKAEW